MKTLPGALALLLLAACARQSADSTQAPAATARGVVTAVDVAAQTLTISHGPVESLQWPAMTMTFKAPAIDLSQLKAGDEIDFEFTSTGMDGTITTIKAR